MHDPRLDGRILILDTETTGINLSERHRVVEIGCVELVNRLPTGRTFQCYINPGRPMPPEAELVHGLTDDFLADKPRFHQVVDGFLAFIGDSPLVAHNAAFDLGYLNFELSLISYPLLSPERTIDTLALARQRLPGAKHSLDALCARFGVDCSGREKHGALLDADLLARVFVELTGGLQIGLALSRTALPVSQRPPAPAVARLPRPHGPTPAELAAHKAFLARVKNPLWLRD